MPDLRPKTARPVPPNAGVAAWYERNLKALVRQMAKATEREVLAAYRVASEAKAQDAKIKWPLPYFFEELLDDIFDGMRLKIEAAGQLLASGLAARVGGYASRGVTAALREAGFAIGLNLTSREKAVMQNIVAENAALIKSIPEQYLDRVRAAVSESFHAGRDIAGLAETLKNDYDITERRARVIAWDQNNKATEALTRARFQEVGISRAVWRHLDIAKKPRASHIAMNGQEFDLNEGLYDPEVGRNVLPAELPGCNCESTGSPGSPK